MPCKTRFVQHRPAERDVAFSVAGHARLPPMQTTMFDPVGLWGLAYWYAVWPLHQIVFAGRLQRIANSAERSA